MVVFYLVMGLLRRSAPRKDRKMEFSFKH